MFLFIYEQCFKIFHRAHIENPKGFHKVIPVVGDMEKPGLGLSNEDRKMLISKVENILSSHRNYY